MEFYMILGVFVASLVAGTYFGGKRLKKDFVVVGGDEVALAVMIGVLVAIVVTFLSIALYCVPLVMMGLALTGAACYFAAKKGMGI